MCVVADRRIDPGGVADPIWIVGQRPVRVRENPPAPPHPDPCSSTTHDSGAWLAKRGLNLALGESAPVGRRILDAAPVLNEPMSRDALEGQAPAPRARRSIRPR